MIGTPRSDRNLITFSVNGVALKAPLQGARRRYRRPRFRIRSDFGITGYDASRQLCRTRTLAPIRTSETSLETFYPINLATSWQITPDFRYFSIPAADHESGNPAQLVHDEAMLGMRTTIAF